MLPLIVALVGVKWRCTFINIQQRYVYQDTEKSMENVAQIISVMPTDQRKEEENNTKA